MSSEHDDDHWALKLLLDRHNWEPSLAQKYGLLVTGGTMGILSALSVNWVMNRPLHAGFQRYIGYTAIGVAIAYGVKVLMDDTLERRDTTMIDYIRRHPERFPEPERKKLGDMFVPWKPIR